MRALEFYSGLGGLHYALAEAVPGSSVVCAFDVNDLANEVYRSNHGLRPDAKSIDALTAADLVRRGPCDLWLLSPPCQPYTRRGKARHGLDTRARSFVRVLETMVTLGPAKPRLVLVENVVGFERSDTRTTVLGLLEGAGYACQEFHASPADLGVPYSRPRYFLCAKREDEGERGEGGVGGGATNAGAGPGVSTGAANASKGASEGATASLSPPPVRRRIFHGLPEETGEGIFAPLFLPDGRQASPPRAPRSRFLSEFLVEDPAEDSAAPPTVVEVARGRRGAAASKKKRGQGEGEGEGARDAGPGGAGVLSHPGSPGGLVRPGDKEGPEPAAPGSPPTSAASPPPTNPLHDPSFAPFYLPPQTLLKSGWCLDLVTPKATRTNCFTKTYGQYIKGSGSVLVTRNAARLPDIWRDFPILDGSQRGAMGSESTEGAPSKAGIPSEGGRGSAEVGAPREGEDDSAEAVRRRTEALAAALAELSPRYLTPREVANLHAFPPSFTFPPHVTIRQRYSLLGNSLSVSVVATIIRWAVAWRP